MIFADQLRDAVRVAERAARPTQILLVRQGFRVEVREGGKRLTRTVPLDELEVSNLNPIVEAIRALNKQPA
jgi:hypothetical protein